jgi:hypothetical protein
MNSRKPAVWRALTTRTIGCFAAYIFAAYILLIAAPDPALAQDSPKELDYSQLPPLPTAQAPPAETADPTLGTGPAIATSHQEQVDVAAKKLRAAKTDDEKLAAKAELRKALAQIFDLDMKIREAQAVHIERRLAQLRKQYQAREKAKDEIIDRRLQAIEQDAADLGFPGTGGSYAPQDGAMSGYGYNPYAAVALDEHLRKYGANAQKRIAELAKVGHFARSPDGKLYAYVENNVEGAERTAQIRVCMAHSGQRIVAANVDMPVGELKFFKDGVATLDADGKPTMRVEFKVHWPAPVESTIPYETFRSSSAPPRTISAVAPSRASTITEFNELRNLYRIARMSLAAVKDPQASSAANLRLAFEEANRLIDSKLRLLALDLKAAEIALSAAESKLNETSRAYEANATTKSEVEKYRAARDTAELDVERAQTLYDLFKSIKDTPPATDGAKPREN